MPQIFRVMVRCPQTRSLLETGIRTSGREALSNNAYRQGIVSCRHCGQFHSIDGDAFLELDQNQTGDALWRPNP